MSTLSHPPPRSKIQRMEKTYGEIDDVAKIYNTVTLGVDLMNIIYCLNKAILFSKRRLKIFEKDLKRNPDTVRVQLVSLLNIEKFEL